jgi:hypothetical protein
MHNFESYEISYNDEYDEFRAHTYGRPTLAFESYDAMLDYFDDDEDEAGYYVFSGTIRDNYAQRPGRMYR